MKLDLPRLAVVMLTLAAAGCASAPPAANPIRDHEEALAASDPKRVGAPAPGSAQETAAVQRFAAFISDLSTGTIRAQIRQVYAPQLYFNDTLKTIRDVDTLEKYFLSSDDALTHYALNVEQATSTPEGVYVRWRMDVTFRRFRKGEVQSSIGISHIRFDKDGRVIYHQDYWDSGSNLYAKIPVLGWMIRAIKNRL